MTNLEIESSVRHRRHFSSLLKALFRGQNYIATIKAFRLCLSPLAFLKRYVTNGGQYPAKIDMRTPLGNVAIEVYTSDDIQTINEIFLRGDYDVGKDNKIIVDFGSNIGISSIYFLTRNPQAFVYCFEPLPQNTERLKSNLEAFADRYNLTEAAVGEGGGTVRFGWEPTGRYGGIGRDTGRWVDVRCIDSNEALREILKTHGRIDLLKIDIETLEKTVTERIPHEILENIRNVVVEYPFERNSLSATHAWEKRKNVTAFFRHGSA